MNTYSPLPHAIKAHIRGAFGILCEKIQSFPGIKTQRNLKTPTKITSSTLREEI